MPAHLFHGLLGTLPDPDKTFLETPDGRVLTYGGLREGTARFAHLLAQRGLKPGDRLAVQVEKSLEAIILYLAAARAGIVFLPLNTAYTVAELEYFVGDAEPALVVVDPARQGAVAPIAQQHGARLETLDARGGGSLAVAA